VRANTDVRVALTAPAGAATVQVALYPYRGGKQAAEATAVRTVQIAAGSLRWIRLTAPVGVPWYSAVVTPAADSGPVLVAHRVRETSSRGDLVTGYPWNPLRVQVTVPTAVQNPAVALR